MYLDDDDTITRPTVFTELDVKQNFEVRKILYENKDLFTNNTEVIDPDLKIIQDNVEKGKQLLVETIKRRNEDELKINELVRHKKNVNITCEDMYRNVSFFMKDGSEQLLDDVNNIRKHLTSLRTILNDNLEKEIAKHSQRIVEDDHRIRQLGTVYGVLRSTTTTNTCPICLVDMVDRFCDPCGHTFCSSCIKANYCFVCRTKINKVHKLFYST